MKILRHSSTRLQGSAILVAVVLTALVTFLLFAYLTLVKTQNYSTARSQAWNNAIPVIEAGLEDALAHLDKNGTNATLESNGWGKNGNRFYAWRHAGGELYLVTISNWMPGWQATDPIIECRAFVESPMLFGSPALDIPKLLSAAKPSYFLAQMQPPTTTIPRNVLIRGVRIRAERAYKVPGAGSSDGQFDIAGNNVTSDSFDSSDPAYNTNGHYDPAKRKAGGDIATNSGLTNSLNVGNADVWGKVATGPGGTVDIGPNGSVGDLQWHLDYKKGIESGYVNDDMNMDFPPVELPTGLMLMSPAPMMYNNTQYTYGLGSGAYQMSSLTLGGSSEKMVVTGNAILIVNQMVSISGSAFIQIAPGASLTMYVRGPSADIGGNGIMNESGFATNFTFYGLPSLTTVGLGGNSAFVGALYAPQANLEFKGGGNTSLVDFTGGFVAKTVKLTGGIAFHYDEALRKYGPPNGFVVKSWNEMTPQESASDPLITSLQYY